MKKAINSTGRPTRRVSGAVLAGAVTAALALAACSSKDILTVPDVDVVKPSALTGKNALPSVLAAAIGDFQVAFGGSGGGGNGASEGQAQMSGLLADEFINAESFPTRIEVDQRNTQVINATMLNIYRDIQKARATAEFADVPVGSGVANTVPPSTAMTLPPLMVVYAIFVCGSTTMEAWLAPVPAATRTLEKVLSAPLKTATEGEISALPVLATKIWFVRGFTATADGPVANPVIVCVVLVAPSITVRLSEPNPGT